VTFDVFVSYPHQDKAIADAACAKLEADGIRCWVSPRDVPPGAEWAGAIVEAIDNCRVMILIFSEDANRSKQVHREVQRAFDGEKPVVPFRIENIMPEKSLAYYMGSVHWLDALTPPLEQHLEKLAASVQALVRLPISERNGHEERVLRETEERRRAEEEKREDERRQKVAAEAERLRLEQEGVAKREAEDKAREEERPVLRVGMQSVDRVVSPILYAGTLLYTWWLLQASVGPRAFATVYWLHGTVPGAALLIMYALAMLLAASTGILRLWAHSRVQGKTRAIRDTCNEIAALAAIPVTLIVIWVMANLFGANQVAVVETMAGPFGGISTLLFIVLATVQMNVRTDECVPGSVRWPLKLGNSALSILIGIAAVYAIITFGTEY